MLPKYSDIVASFALIMAAIAIYLDYVAYNRMLYLDDVAYNRVHSPPTIYSNLIEYAAWNNKTLEEYNAVGQFKFSITNNKSEPIFIVRCTLATPFGSFAGGGYGDAYSQCTNFEKQINDQSIRLEAGETKFFEEHYNYATNVFSMNDPMLQTSVLRSLGHGQSFINALVNNEEKCEIHLGSGRGTEVGFAQSCEFTSGQVLFSMILQTSDGQIFREDFGIFGNWPWGDMPSITMDLILKE